MSDHQPGLHPYQTNDGFSKDQTLFLIDIMRQYITVEGDSLPSNLHELNTRLKNAKPNKKILWEEVTEKLGSHFQQSFCPVKVARKWNTLVEGYKKVKDSQRNGKGSMRFKFYTEMDNLIGVEHDVVYPVIVGASEGLEVRRPEALGDDDGGGGAAFVHVLSGPVEHLGGASTLAKSATPVPHKRRRLDDEIMDFLRQSEEASQRRHEEILAQLKSAQQCFEVLMTKLIEKL